MGHQVIEAATVDEALALSDIPGLNWVISDLRLGPEDGVSLLTQLAHRAPGLQLALMTSVPATDPRREEAASRWPVLPKPVDRVQLARLFCTGRGGMNEPLVTILDDEPQIRTMLSDALTEAGFRTAAFARATEFEAALKRQTPDVCLVDLGLPDRDGLALVHRLALESGAAIIIISGRAQVQDRVTGLELGADDYIIKPFDPAEVVARIRARLRVPASAPKPWRRRSSTAGPRISTATCWSRTTATEVALSHAEGEVLRLFPRKPQAPDFPQQMQESLGGAAGESFDRAMDVRISRLRTKLGEDPKNPRLIKTIYGAGYIFLGDVTWR
jgi:two-component system OmpR family response regulator